MNTLHQINEKARNVLRAALGPVDYARYQQQFSLGSGDYTAERQAVEQPDIDTICERVAQMEAAGLLVPPPNARLLEGAP